MRVVGIVGWKNSGKTGLVERLVTEFTARGQVVSTIKHAHHAFDVDQPGKDSHRHRSAGAREVLLASATRWVLMHELRDAPEPGLAELLERLSPADLVIVEGFKAARLPKIEAYRQATGQPLLARDDPDIAAIAAEGRVTPETDRPVLDLDDTAAVADTITAMLGL